MKHFDLSPSTKMLFILLRHKASTDAKAMVDKSGDKKTARGVISAKGGQGLHYN